MAAVFFDRDGTLGGDGWFVHPDEFRLYPEAPEAIRLVNAAGWKAIVITSQTRVGSGEITLGQVEASFERLQADLSRHGAHLDGWYICPHLPTDNCRCRKPSPYLLRRAARDFGLNLAASYVVGDRGDTDLLAGRAAGCRTCLVLTGLGAGSLGPYRHTWAAIEPDLVAANVLEAVRLILESKA